MQRTAMNFLIEWLQSEERKPLVIRGARQVGKTWLVRELAKSQDRKLIEINFEKQPKIIALFEPNDPDEILSNLTVAFRSIDPKKSILFLDEIQDAPELLAKLRWFAEDMPELPVIAAGSLLEFVLAEHSFSMPVGRIEYMHLEPLSFEEFLLAGDSIHLVNYIKSFTLDRKIPLTIHEQLMKSFKEYLIVGGMPSAVASWAKKHSLKAVGKIHHNLMITYRDDFAKYSKKITTERLDEVVDAIPTHLGKKFVYSKVNPLVKIEAIKQALDLLCKARICHKVQSCAANGIPLAAEIQSKYFKVIFLDVGLCSAALGLSLGQLNKVEEIDLINSGGIAEQAVGQLLRTIDFLYIEPALYYWHREEKWSQAAIDYVIQHRNRVIPIEVKAGSAGKLKSVHVFMGLKHFPIAVRINSASPHQNTIAIKDSDGKDMNYILVSLPFYLLGELHRLLNHAFHDLEASNNPGP